ncbi:MAG TPA: hypothetical protein VHX88_15295 [Solirubrobacteraceae bacterium]|jgi:hypothetical protein|nr:hypothetical protein [Solirubrobacteraceae bacterium]
MTGPVLPELAELLHRTADRQAALAVPSAPVVVPAAPVVVPAAPVAAPTARPPRRRRTLPRGALVGVVLALCAGSALAATHPWSPTLGGPHRGHVTTSTTPVPTSERALLAVLRRPQDAADRSAPVQATLRGLVGVEDHGVRLAAVRNLGRSPADPSEAILLLSLVHQGLLNWPGAGSANAVCMLFPVVFASHTRTVIGPDGRRHTARTGGGAGAGEGCGNAARLREGGIATMVGAQRGFYLAGLVPDGVRTVQVTVPGHVLAVSVHENLYVAFLGGTLLHPPFPTAVAWLSPAGRRVGPAPRPGHRAAPLRRSSTTRRVDPEGRQPPHQVGRRARGGAARASHRTAASGTCPASGRAQRSRRVT